jgi:type IV secretory pathway VirB4 component
MATASKTTQEFVPIKEIRDGIVILNDGSLRAIVLATSVNFALKSTDEQNSIIFQFQNFLNSLDFSVQIFVESKKLDIRPYIALLESRYKEQQTELMKIQTREYIEFVKTFVDNSSIMTKSFFVVIPYSPAQISLSKNPIKSLFGKKGAGGGGDGGSNDTGSSAAGSGIQNKEKTLANDEFEESRSQLEQRIGSVEQGLTRCGIRVAELGTEEVVELFYKIFNPGDTEKPMQIN